MRFGCFDKVSEVLLLFVVDNFIYNQLSITENKTDLGI